MICLYDQAIRLCGNSKKYNNPEKLEKTQKMATMRYVRFKVTVCVYLSPNNRARSLSTLMAEIVDKDTPHNVGCVPCVLTETPVFVNQGNTVNCVQKKNGEPFFLKPSFASAMIYRNEVRTKHLRMLIFYSAIDNLRRSDE